MESPGPLDTVDPNILSRQPKGKLKAAEQPLSRAPPSSDHQKSEAPVSGTTMNVTGGLSHVTRPSLTGMPSFQRPRKRVVWRNKACFIALPLEDEFGRKTSRKSYLGLEEVERNLKDWKQQGFDTNGFTLAPQTSDLHSPLLEGQSRAVHPDPEDGKRERADGTYRVNIPDRRDWEAYVNHLREEKLRALGVDESLMSRRGSSQTSAELTSPALASSSVHACPIPIQGAANPASYVGKPGVSHFPSYSMAHPFTEPSLMSPNQFSQPSEPHTPGTWSPQRYFSSQQGSRVSSPIVNGQIQKLGHAAPIASHIEMNNVGRGFNPASSDLPNRMREQQALLQIQQLQQQHQQQQTLQQRSLPSLAISQIGEQVMQPVTHQNQAEIVTPVPRGHHQNPSENLQKGVDEAEAHPSYSMGENGRQQSSNVVQNDRGNCYCKTKDTFCKVEEMASKNTRANESGLDANPSVMGIPDRETNHPGQSQRRFPSKTSQLNVNAPKFEPRVLGTTGVFAFNGACQASKFNVAAPAFMPRLKTSNESSFSALRPSFRPDAPAFKPSEEGILPSPEPTSEQNTVQPVQKIFGDINFSEVIKPTNPEAIPIRKLNKESENKKKFDGDMGGQEDESGRITQADGRQKRMRHDCDGGDQVPLFASPEGKNPWIDRASENRAAYSGRMPLPESDEVDATTLDVATDLLEGLIDDLSATEVSDLMREDESVDADGKHFEPHTFNDFDDAASFNAARLPDITSHEVRILSKQPCACWSTFRGARYVPGANGF